MLCTIGCIMLAGSLPNGLLDCLDNSTTTATINFSNNLLSGTLPTLGNNTVPGLQLYLASNWLSGGLPEEWGAHLDSIWHLDLRSNHLSGSIPSFWDSPKLSNLYTLNLASNPCLCGTIPINIQSL
jgi:hypothetical protein